MTQSGLLTPLPTDRIPHCVIGDYSDDPTNEQVIKALTSIDNMFLISTYKTEAGKPKIPQNDFMTFKESKKIIIKVAERLNSYPDVVQQLLSDMTEVIKTYAKQPEYVEQIKQIQGLDLLFNKVKKLFLETYPNLIFVQNHVNSAIPTPLFTSTNPSPSSKTPNEFSDTESAIPAENEYNELIYNDLSENNLRNLSLNDLNNQEIIESAGTANTESFFLPPYTYDVSSLTNTTLNILPTNPPQSSNPINIPNPNDNDDDCDEFFLVSSSPNSLPKNPSADNNGILQYFQKSLQEFFQKTVNNNL